MPASPALKEALAAFSKAPKGDPLTDLVKLKAEPPEEEDALKALLKKLLDRLGGLKADT